MAVATSWTLRLAMSQSKNRIWKATNLKAAWGPREDQFLDVSFEILEGEKVALISDSSETRNLLLRVLTGLQPRRGGELEILSHNVEKLPISADWEQIIPTSIRRRMGICLENEGLLSNVTIREGLELLFRFKYGDHNQKLREGAKKIVAATAVSFGITEILDKRPNLLSSTEKRLCGLARAYLSKPHVLAFENPTKGVGDRSRSDFYSLFETMTLDNSRTFLFSTDDWVFARKFCTRWIVLQGQRLVFDGRPAEFLMLKNDFTNEIRDLEHYSKNLNSLIKELAC